MLVFEQKHPDICSFRSPYPATFSGFPENFIFRENPLLKSIWYCVVGSPILQRDFVKKYNFQQNLQKWLDKENGSWIYQRVFAKKRAFAHNSQIERVRGIFLFPKKEDFSGVNIASNCAKKKVPKLHFFPSECPPEKMCFF